MATALTRLFDETYALYDLLLKSPSGEEETARFYLRDLLSGALLARVAERAALIRVEACEADVRVPLGISESDCQAAVHQTYKEQGGVSHREDLEEYAASRGMVLLKASKVPPIN